MSVFGQYPSISHFQTTAKRTCLWITLSLSCCSSVSWNEIIGGKRSLQQTAIVGVEINVQVRSSPLLLFPIPSRCHSLAREDCSLRKGLLHGGEQIDRHCPPSLVKTCYSSIGLCGRRVWTFSGEQCLVQNVSSYSAVGGLRVLSVFTLVLTELSGFKCWRLAVVFLC